MLALAMLGTVAIGVFEVALEQRLAVLRVAGDVRHLVLQEGSEARRSAVPQTIDSQSGAAIARALAESFVSSFRVVMLVTAGLAVVSAVCAAFTSVRRALVTNHIKE